MPPITPPKIPECEPWPLMVRLEKEKEVTGIFLSGHPLDSYRFELKHYHIASLQELKTCVEETEAKAAEGQPFKERGFRLAGFISEAQDRISKSGKKYGKIILQDFSGNLEIMFFGEDYVRFAQYLRPGLTVFVMGMVQSRQFRREQIEFRVQQIQLLEDIKRKQSRELVVATPADQLTEGQVRFLTENIRANPGSCEMLLQLTDPRNGWRVDLRSINKKLEMNDELADFLEKQDNLNIRINIINT
jgi:DNA polymerase-3 subunit alpha